MSYTPDTLARLQADAAQIIARYPDGHSRSGLLPMLHLVQSATLRQPGRHRLHLRDAGPASRRDQRRRDLLHAVQASPHR